MKRLATFGFTLSLLMYVTSVTAFAQGRGNGRGPSVHSAARQGHGPQTRQSKTQPKSGQASGKTTFSQRIEQNPDLSARLTKMLPAGTDMQTAASGFKNQGQFIAALHVSKNLNIPFEDLKLRMTGSDAKSLGSAIQELRPSLPESEVEKESEKAEKQAKATEKNKDLT